VKLNIGCGLEYKKGYVNIDAFDETVADQVMSALNLEFEDNIFSQVDCTQVLEHLGAAKSIYALAEVYRVLKPSGLFLIEIPDLKSSFKMFLKGREDQRKLLMNWIYGLDSPGMSHKYGFPEELLERMLIETGFVDIEITHVDTKSDYPSLRATSRKVDSTTHHFFTHFRRTLLLEKLVDLDNQVDVIEKEAILQDLLRTALNSRNDSLHLKRMLRVTSTSSPEIGRLYLETAVNHNLLSVNDASSYIKVLKDLVTLGYARVMTHMFKDMPVIPGQQTETYEMVKSLCVQSVEKLFAGDHMVLDELRNTSKLIDDKMQTDLFSKTVLEMNSLSQLGQGAKAFSQDNLDVALIHYQKAIRFNRDSVLAYWNLARVRTMQNMRDKAIHCYGVTKDLLKLKYPKLQRTVCKRVDNEIDYVANGNREKINQPILSLQR
jgi:predicted SAM-dependent methyltransferase